MPLDDTAFKLTLRLTHPGAFLYVGQSWFQNPKKDFGFGG